MPFQIVTCLVDFSPAAQRPGDRMQLACRRRQPAPALVGCHCSAPGRDRIAEGHQLERPWSGSPPGRVSAQKKGCRRQIADVEPLDQQRTTATRGQRLKWEILKNAVRTQDQVMNLLTDGYPRQQEFSHFFRIASPTGITGLRK